MTFFLHLGFHKTGSSAIQEFVLEHRDYLRANGLDYPVPLCRYPSHGELAWAYLGEMAPWRDDDYDPNEVLKHYEAIINANKAENIHTILSNEDVSLIADDRVMLERFAEAVKPLAPVIIAYVRDPVDYIFSSYHHAVIEGHTKRSFKDWFVIEFHADAVDFRTRVERWEAVFGQESLLVREYGANGTGAVSDFLSIFGIDTPLGEIERRVNVGIHPWFADSYRAIVDGPSGEQERQALIRASAEAPHVNPADFYLGPDAEIFKSRLRDSYTNFLNYAKTNYRH